MWPDKIRRFTRHSSKKRAGIIPVMFVYCRATFACAHTKACTLSTTRYDFCVARSRNHHLRFRPVYVWLLLIIVVSRPVVRQDITAAMAVIPEIGSVAMALVSQGWAENIAYGRRTAREIVLALIVDDGVRGRGHRKNIFNPTYNVAGAAYGSHARLGSVCSIDLASGYAENGFVRAASEAQDSF
jgi:hypothetical protein